MRHFDELKEGDQVVATRQDGSHALTLEVRYKEIDVIYLGPYIGDASYKLDRYTKKLYKWTTTGWDTVKQVFVGPISAYDHFGD